MKSMSTYPPANQFRRHRTATDLEFRFDAFFPSGIKIHHVWNEFSKLISIFIITLAMCTIEYAPRVP